MNSLVDADENAKSSAVIQILERSWEGALPEACPWHIDDIVGYDTRRRLRAWPGRLPEPDVKVWPAPVARRLNEVLGMDYLEGRPRGSRSRGLSR